MNEIVTEVEGFIRRNSIRRDGGMKDVELRREMEDQSPKKIRKTKRAVWNQAAIDICTPNLSM